MMAAFWGAMIYVVLAQERISPVFRRFSGIVETSLRVMAKAMRAAAMKAMKAVNKGTKAAFFPTKAMRAAKAAAPKKAMKAVSKATKQAIVPTKAMRAAAMKAMKVVSKAAKEQAFVATKAMRKAKAAAPAPKKAMK